MKEEIKKYKEKYKAYCWINNLVENKRDFKFYMQDQKMLERFKK